MLKQDYHAPETRREDVRETLHGHELVDPYRWLEDEADPAVVAWTDAQNAYTKGILKAYPGRAKIEQRLGELLQIGVVGTPAVREGRYFYVRREGQQNQPILYWRNGLDGAEQVLLDPNTAKADGTVVLDWYYPSEDGKLLAYGYSEHGDEKSTLYVVEVESGKLLPDQIAHARYSSLAWLKDGSGFYYTRYPAPGEVPAGEENYHQHVFFHQLGSDPAQDRKIYGEGRAMTDNPAVELSKDGRYLLIAMYKGWTRNDLYVQDLQQRDSKLQTVVSDRDALYNVAEAIDGKLYLTTNEDAPNFKAMVVDLQQPAREHWQELIAERPETTIEDMRLLGGKLLLQELHNVTSQVGIYSLAGKPLGSVPVPANGSVTAVRGDWRSDEIFIGYESFTQPPTIYRYDLGSSTISVWAQVETPLDTSQFQVEQVWYRSKDGTRVPMFVVSKRGMAHNDKNPTLLSGYGGFNVSRTPLFGRAIMLWLEHGGSYVVANLRGGAEFGESWHRAGMLANKQNVFDDFIAAAEYLISEGYTDSKHLAIQGGSNGGLLMGAMLTQRPELFKAIVCQVPLLDMLRYHHFRIARLWVDEYGSADDAEQFNWLYAYSPYHRVRPGIKYPPILITTGASDSRVDPLHARKMAALLQHVSEGSTPVLLRVEQEAGHGQGKPLSKQVAEQADIYSFLFSQLGLE